MKNPFQNLIHGPRPKFRKLLFTIYKHNNNKDLWKCATTKISGYVILLLRWNVNFQFQFSGNKRNQYICLLCFSLSFNLTVVYKIKIYVSFEKMTVLVVSLYDMTWLSLHSFFFIWNKVARNSKKSESWEKLSTLWKPCFHPSFSKVDTWNCFVNVNSGKSIVNGS